MNLRASLRARRLRIEARRLRVAERALKDAIHRLDKWGFADSPSQHEDREERICALVREVERLGGDAMACFDDVFTRWDRDYLLEEAMPHTFERVRDDHGNSWTTQRKTEATA